MAFVTVDFEVSLDFAYMGHKESSGIHKVTKQVSQLLAWASTNLRCHDHDDNDDEDEDLHLAPAR